MLVILLPYKGLLLLEHLMLSIVSKERKFDLWTPKCSLFPRTDGSPFFNILFSFLISIVFGKLKINLGFLSFANLCFFMCYLDDKIINLLKHDDKNPFFFRTQLDAETPLRNFLNSNLFSNLRISDHVQPMVRNAVLYTINQLADSNHSYVVNQKIFRKKRFTANYCR